MNKMRDRYITRSGSLDEFPDEGGRDDSMVVGDMQESISQGVLEEMARHDPSNAGELYSQLYAESKGLR